MNQRILYIFTRTPLHVGAGSSVGAIDQPIIRERHTGFPIIPASSLKGTFADTWGDGLHEQNGKRNLRVTTRKNGDKEELDQVADAAWLFGSDNANHSFAGALQFSEARLLAFPIRSARGSFAWVTCPLLLQRAKSDGVISIETIPPEPKDEEALFTEGKVEIDGRIVLEEYTFTKAGDCPANIGSAVAGILEDPIWQEIPHRLVILSNGMLSFFAQNACEIAQHVRISDETGTAETGGLFNQENVPSETLFFAIVRAFKERTPHRQGRPAETALDTFASKIKAEPVFQFGGDASTGLGYCSVSITGRKGE